MRAAYPVADVRPAEQRVMVFRKLTVDAVNRAGTTLDGARFEGARNVPGELVARIASPA